MFCFFSSQQHLTKKKTKQVPTSNSIEITNTVWSGELKLLGKKCNRTYRFRCYIFIQILFPNSLILTIFTSLFYPELPLCTFFFLLHLSIACPSFSSSRLLYPYCLICFPYVSLPVSLLRLCGISVALCAFLSPPTWQPSPQLVAKVTRQGGK